MTTPTSGDNNSLPDDSSGNAEFSPSSDNGSVPQFGQYAAPSGAPNPAQQPPAAPTPQYGQYAAPSGAPNPAQQPPAAPTPQYGQYAAPSGAPTPQYGQYGAPQYGGPQYGAPQTGEPQYGAPQYGGPQYNGPGPMNGGFGNFNAALKPGIIPLRPLSLLEVFDGVFGALRKAPGVIIGLIGAVVAVFMAISVVLAYVVAPWINAQIASTTGEFGEILNDPIMQESGVSSMSLSLGFMSMLVVPLATVIASGIVVVAIGQLVINRKITASQAWIKVSPRLVKLFGVFFVVSVLASLAYGLFVVVVSFIGGIFGDTALVVAMLLSLLVGFVVFMVFQIKWAFAPSVLVLEERGVFASIKRSSQLVKGSFWRVLGYYLLAAIGLSTIAGFVTQFAVSALMLIGGANFLNEWWGVVGYSVIQTAAMTVQVGLLSAVITILYVDIRMRREALDLELIAAANNQP